MVELVNLCYFNHLTRETTTFQVQSKGPIEFKTYVNIMSGKRGIPQLNSMCFFRKRNGLAV